jgi:hypothetical protein
MTVILWCGKQILSVQRMYFSFLPALNIFYTKMTIMALRYQTSKTYVSLKFGREFWPIYLSVYMQVIEMFALHCVGTDVLRAAVMHISIFWDVTLCSLLKFN